MRGRYLLVPRKNNIKNNNNNNHLINLHFSFLFISFSLLWTYFLFINVCVHQLFFFLHVVQCSGVLRPNRRHHNLKNTLKKMLYLYYSNSLIYCIDLRYYSLISFHFLIIILYHLSLSISLPIPSFHTSFFHFLLILSLSLSLSQF